MTKQINFFIVITTSIILILVFFKVSCTPVPVTNCISCAVQSEQINHEHLRATVKVLAVPNIGSGTIIYYDKIQKFAYVASAGHLWQETCHKCEVEYMGKKYPAIVLFCNKIPGSDCSLLRFQPDTEPEYFPIAPEHYHLTIGQQYYSIGCDFNTSPTRYFVEYVGLRKLGSVSEPLTTTMYNSPRPGRSGGGLLDANFLIGICFGTQSRDGTGYGFFTSLSSIRKVFKDNGYEWLLKIPLKCPARQIPVYDHMRNITLPDGYLPVPLTQ